jgi:DNA-binding beta-propeller fold protein YncE
LRQLAGFFVAGSVVHWNGSDRPTTSNGSINGLTAQISASDIAAAGTAVVTVVNPAPGGGSSNSLTFTVTTGAVDPQSIAVDPAGKLAYVMNGGGTLYDRPALDRLLEETRIKVAAWNALATP